MSTAAESSWTMEGAGYSEMGPWQQHQRLLQAVVAAGPRSVLWCDWPGPVRQLAAAGRRPSCVADDSGFAVVPTSEACGLVEAESSTWKSRAKGHGEKEGKGNQARALASRTRGYNTDSVQRWLIEMPGAAVVGLSPIVGRGLFFSSWVGLPRVHSPP